MIIQRARWRGWLKPLKFIFSSHSISLISLIISILALFAAYNANRLTRLTEGLDLKPAIIFKAWFNQNDKNSPYFVIKNEGPIDAQQLEVAFSVWRFSKELRRPLTVAGGPSSGCTFEIPILKAKESKVFKIPDLLEKEAQINADAAHYATVEARIEYVRDPDKKKFVERAFYFLNDEGHVVGLYDNSIKDEKFDDLKKFVIQRNLSDLPTDFSSRMSDTYIDRKYQK